MKNYDMYFLFTGYLIVTSLSKTLLHSALLFSEVDVACRILNRMHKNRLVKFVNRNLGTTLAKNVNFGPLLAAAFLNTSAENYTKCVSTSNAAALLSSIQTT